MHTYVVAATIALIVLCLTLLATVRMALADSTPEERPEILRALAKIVEALARAVRRH